MSDPGLGEVVLTPVLPRGLASPGDTGSQVDVEGRRVLALAAGLLDLATTTPRNVARLLLAFDPWVIGLSAASRRSTLRTSGASTSQDRVSPVILADGGIAGGSSR